jgi:hypothetical protein
MRGSGKSSDTAWAAAESSSLYGEIKHNGKSLAKQYIESTLDN